MTVRAAPSVFTVGWRTDVHLLYTVCVIVGADLNPALSVTGGGGIRWCVSSEAADNRRRSGFTAR